MKPGSRDKSYSIHITGLELEELKELTWSMADSFGLDGRIERYQGKRPISFYSWDLDCLEDVLSLGIDDLRKHSGEESPRFEALMKLRERIQALRAEAYRDLEP
jgi:hypothetical protein